MLKSQSFGQKDIQQSYFRVWEEIFRPTLRKSKQDIISDPSAQANIKTLKPSTIKIQTLLTNLSKFSNPSDMDRLFDGCFENFLNCKTYQNHFSKVRPFIIVVIGMKRII